jgi:hypothetical protein
MVRSMTKRGMPKPFAILIAALMALYFVPLGALPASAQTVGGFEIEGNLVDDADPGIDWASVDTSSVSFSTAVDHTTGGQDDTTFGGGSKEYNDGGQNGWPAWAFGGGNAPGKSDFGRWATYTNSDANNHEWLFLGFDRDFAQGTAKYAFELNQVMQPDPDNPNPTRSQGDLKFIIWDQGNGALTLTGDAMNTDVGLYKWVDPDQAAAGVAVDTDKDGHWVKVVANGTFVGAINTAAVTVPSWWTSRNVTTDPALGQVLTADKFGEFGVDLTSFGAVLGCPSHGFAAANARSITGTGTTGELVDYLSALGVHIPSTCTSLVTEASDQVVIGGSISDTATITPSNATGAVTFNVYGPDDADCSGDPVTTLGPITVVNGSASSGPYTPAAVGAYRWIASYVSDDQEHFADSTGACNDPNEQSTVVKSPTKITTTAGSSGTLPGAVTISDIAHLTGLTATAGGTVSFTVYGPFAANSSPTCTGTPKSVDVNLGSVGADHAIDVASGPVTVTAAGKYYWVASYSGDPSNEAVAGTCGDDNETSTVGKASPAISTVAVATDATLPATSVQDTAKVTGLSANATGAVGFTIYSNSSCTTVLTTLGPVPIGTVTGGTATVSSPAYTGITAAGDYFFIASYSGDANNNGVAGKCGDANESVHVNPAPVAVLPEKQGKPPVVVLPHTGVALSVGRTAGAAIFLLGLGLLLVAAGRRRITWLPRR